MEGLTRLVTESLARHGFDRPLDYRRLHWSRWFRCDSPHSLLFVPSKPGVFALAEEITHVATAASAVPRSEASGPAELPLRERLSDPVSPSAAPDLSANREGHDFSRALNPLHSPTALAAVGITNGSNPANQPRRMLAVTQFFETATADNAPGVPLRHARTAEVVHGRSEVREAWSVAAAVRITKYMMKLE